LEGGDAGLPDAVQVGVGREPVVELEHDHAVGERPQGAGAGLAAGDPQDGGRGAVLEAMAASRAALSGRCLSSEGARMPSRSARRRMVRAAVPSSSSSRRPAATASLARVDVAAVTGSPG